MHNGVRWVVVRSTQLFTAHAISHIRTEFEEDKPHLEHAPLFPTVTNMAPHFHWPVVNGTMGQPNGAVSRAKQRCHRQRPHGWGPALNVFRCQDAIHLMMKPTRCRGDCWARPCCHPLTDCGWCNTLPSGWAPSPSRCFIVHVLYITCSFSETLRVCDNLFLAHVHNLLCIILHTGHF